MKKTLGLIIAAVLLFSGCGTAKPATEGALVDGSYRAEMSQEFADSEGHGWKGYLVLEVKGGAIANADFDFTNADNQLKSEQTAETYPMDPVPKDWIPTLEASAKKAATAEDIDAVTGATNSSNELKQLFTAALEAAKTGKTETVIVK